MTTTYELYTNENGTPKAVEGKAPAIIERVEALETEVTGLDTALAGKAPMSHTHTIANVTSLQTALDAKANDADLQVDLTAIRESINNVSSKVDGIGGTLSLAKKQTILDACDQAMNGANPVHAGDPTLDEIKVALATIQGQLDQLESRRYVKETGKSSDGNSWYRKWSDGWLEQGGSVEGTPSSVTYLKQFKDVAYTLLCAPISVRDSNERPHYLFANEKTPNGFKFASQTHISMEWYACGY